MLLSIIVFLLVLGVLVFVHELGHFMVAKWVGMRVDEFAIGFPPRLFAKKVGETTYAINALPLGGYVKIHGEGADSEILDPRSFGARPVFARIAVIVAGVIMNLLFAFTILCVAYSVGFPSGGLGFEKIPGAVVQESKVYVSGVLADSPAKKAGVKAGDQIVAFTNPQSGEKTVISSVEEMIEYTREKQNRGEVDLLVALDNSTEARTVPVQINASGPALGTKIQESLKVRVPVWRAPEASVKFIYYIGYATWDALKGFGQKLFVHGELDPAVSGPVGIYKVTDIATQQGVGAVTLLVVVLSINLALLNILPIPALDGGKLFFLLIELVFRKRVVSEKIEAGFTTLGFLLLIGLIAVISLRDIGLF